VLATPLDQNVVGGLSQVVKTAGADSIAARTIRKDSVLRGAMGQQPSQRNSPAFGRPTDFYARRPTTRMGVEWEWRSAFHKTALGQNEGGERETLAKALKGELVLSIAAWTTQDIRTTVYAVEEVKQKELFRSQGLDKPRVVIDAAAEAWKEPQLLARNGIPVVLPPFTATGRTREGALMPRNAAEELRKAGVVFALSAHGSGSYDSNLAVQAGAAMSGGLSFDEALKAVTSTPARLVGADERVGALEEGKDADLALWNGEPFEPTSRVVAVIVDGVLVWDGRD
jgi:imidazolonepropionase-like amidohydrolase